MPDDVRAMLDKLERLEKAATPGPWKKYPKGNRQGHVGEVVSIEYRTGGPGNTNGDYGGLILSGGVWYSMERDRCVDQLDVDGNLIAAARNALPTLLRLARRAGEMEAVVVAARKFVSDGPTQASGANLMSMSAALAALKEPTND